MASPSCMSSEYSVLQPASNAAATIMPSYTLNWHRSARARPRTWVSSVRGTTSHSSRSCPQASATSGQSNENFRRRVLAHSLSTWTLTVPPARRMVQERSAKSVPPTSAYTATLVSKKTSVFIISIGALKSVPRGNEAGILLTKLAQPCYRFLPVDLALDFQALARCFDNLDLVAFGKAEIRNELSGQPHGEAVAPFRDLHDNLLDIHCGNVYPWAGLVKIDRLQPTLG